MSVLQMRLYPKKLNNLAELKQEKEMLRKAREATELKHMLGVDEIAESVGKSKLVDFVLSAVSSPAAYRVLFTIAPDVVRLFRKDRKKNNKEDYGEKAEHQDDHSFKDRAEDVLKKAGKEFIGSYLKWKALQLTLLSIRRFAKARREAKKRKHISTLILILVHVMLSMVFRLGV